MSRSDSTGISAGAQLGGTVWIDTPSRDSLESTDRRRQTRCLPVQPLGGDEVIQPLA